MGWLITISILVCIVTKIVFDYKTNIKKNEDKLSHEKNLALNKLMVESLQKKQQYDEKTFNQTFYIQRDKPKIIEFIKKYCNSVNTKPIDILTINPVDSFEFDRKYIIKFSHKNNDTNLTSEMELVLNKGGILIDHKLLKETTFNNETMQHMLLYSNKYKILKSNASYKMLESAESDETMLVSAETDEKKLGFIYIMRSHINGKFLYKIGETIDVDRRLKELKTGNPSIELYFHSPTKDRQLVEKKLHSEFDYSRVNGEWFDIEPSKILYAYTRLTS